MGITVATNMASVNARRHLDESNGLFQKATERITSGRRINSIGDDAAGLTIAFSLEAKIRSIQQAKRNSEDALSLIQVAEGGMNEVGNLLVRMRELAIQASSDNVGDKERAMIEMESSQIKQEVDRLSEATKFFDTHLLNGTGKDFVFQIGIDNDENNRLKFATSQLDLRSSTLGISGVDLSEVDSARDALANIDSALVKMNEPRASVGAMQSRMNSIITNLDVYRENLIAAKGRIMDADVALESANMVKAAVLQRSGVAVVAQANQVPALALKLVE